MNLRASLAVGLVALVCLTSMGARWRCWNCGPCECAPCYCPQVEPQAKVVPLQRAASPQSAISNRQSANLAVGHAQAIEHAVAPEVDSAAVRRRGDYVEHTTDIMAEADRELFAAIAAVPEDDNGKWYISVITMKGCEPCQRLKGAWRADPTLLAWANPLDPKTSWAHYNEYDKDDRSQAFRWEGVQFVGFPTVLLQPPRNGKYGDPRTVVYGKPYPGSPKKLAEQMRTAMKRYLEKLPKQAAVQEKVRGHAGPAEGTIAADPPWTPNPKNEPLTPYTPQPVNVPPDNPSPLAPSEGGGLSFFWLAVTALVSQVTHFLPPLWRKLVQTAIASIQAAAAAQQAKPADAPKT